MKWVELSRNVSRLGTFITSIACNWFSKYEFRENILNYWSFWSILSSQYSLKFNLWIPKKTGLNLCIWDYFEDLTTGSIWKFARQIEKLSDFGLFVCSNRIRFVLYLHHVEVIANTWMLISVMRGKKVNNMVRT